MRGGVWGAGAVKLVAEGEGAVPDDAGGFPHGVDDLFVDGEAGDVAGAFVGVDVAGLGWGRSGVGVSRHWRAFSVRATVQRWWGGCRGRVRRRWRKCGCRGAGRPQGQTDTFGDGLGGSGCVASAHRWSSFGRDAIRRSPQVIWWVTDSTH